MKKRKFASLIASALAVCVIFSGCLPSALIERLRDGRRDNSSRPEMTESQPEILRRQFDFNELEYVRPDLDKMNAMVDQALGYVEEGGKQEETLALYDEILREIGNLDTMDTIASIRHDLDLTDEYYDKEMTDLDEFYTRFDNRMNELTGAILASDYAGAAREAWGEDFIGRYEVNSKLNSPQIEDLSKQEQDLANEYSKLLTKDYTTELDGETVTIDDLDLASQEGVKAYYEIYEKKNRELGEIYRELVTLRVEMAKKLGYDHYTDYAYDLLGRDYTKEDAAAFSQQVKEIIVPLYQQLNDQYYTLIAEAKSRSSVVFDDGLPILTKALEKEYPPKMSEALSFMLSCNLYDFSDAPNKMHAGFTTLLNDLSAPYMFINTNDYQSPDTLFHEFGHYYNFYLMGPTTWNDGNNLDTAEIHSQALEVLMYDVYPELYGDDAELFIIDSLQSLLGSVLQGCAEDEFQQRVFENPEMSLEEMNLLHAQIYQEYIGYPLVYEWVDIHHHFETPFYYISYATSAISALELWEVSTQSRERALKIYDQITQYTVNVEYLQALRESGLNSPFNGTCVEDIGKALKREIQSASTSRAA